MSLCKVVEISSNTFVKNRLHFGVIKYRKGEILELILDNTKLLQVEWYPKVELSVFLKKNSRRNDIRYLITGGCVVKWIFRKN